MRNMTLYFILHTLWSIFGVIFILRCSFSPASSWAWCLAMALCPWVATLMLWLTLPSASCMTNISYSRHYNRLQRAVETLTNGRLSTRNQITALHNANATFSAIIRDLQRAQEEIIFEYYIIDNDYIGSTILSLLGRKARAGVRVKIIYDAIGSWRLDKKLLSQMKNSGIELRCYNALHFPYLLPSSHRRNHRKIILIDRRILYLGGINIASRYLGHSEIGFWRDDHLRIEGEAAYKAAMYMFPNEKTSVRKRLSSSICPMQFVCTSAHSSPSVLLYIFMETLGAARHSIRISTPYFLPPSSVLDSICMAAQSGVEVELIVPAKTDVALINWASMPALRRCAEYGVKIYRYEGGFLHSKVIVVDSSITIVGSANMDYRSIYYNLEVAAIIYNKPLAKHYDLQFDSDVAHSRRVDILQLQSSTFARIKEGVAQLVAPLL